MWRISDSSKPLMLSRAPSVQATVADIAPALREYVVLSAVDDRPPNVVVLP
jgi:hypothetical protein